MKTHERAFHLLRIGGISFILISLTHPIIPSLFQWKASFIEVGKVHVLGVELFNPDFLYLFNADLFFYEMMLGILSIFFAYRIRVGERSAAIFSISVGIFFLIRTPLQYVYFDFTWIDNLQAGGSFLLALVYLYPLLHYRKIVEVGKR